MRVLVVLIAGVGTLAMWSQIAKMMSPVSDSTAEIMGMLVVVTVLCAMIGAWVVTGDPK